MQIHAQETGIQSQVMKEKFQHADVYNSLLIGVYLLWKRAQYTLRLRKDFPVLTDTNRDRRIFIDILNIKDVIIYRLTVK